MKRAVFTAASLFTFILVSLIVVGIFSTTVIAAGPVDGIVACTGVYDPNDPEAIPCGTCEFMTTLNRAVLFLITIASIVATIALVVVGLKLVTSGGDASAKSAAKQTLWYIVLGLFFIIAAYAIINAIIIALVPENSPIRQWRNFDTCIYATRPNYDFSSQTPGGGVGGGPTGPTSNVGACNIDNLSGTFGSLAPAASCIIQHESSCGGLLESVTDRTADGQAFSYGAMQINLSVHTLQGCTGDYNPTGATLDCKSAFSGRNYTSRVINQTLYDQCAAAAKDLECNINNGLRIYEEAGNSWRPWSTAGGCGLI